MKFYRGMGQLWAKRDIGATAEFYAHDLLSLHRGFLAWASSVELW